MGKATAGDNLSSWIKPILESKEVVALLALILHHRHGLGGHISPGHLVTAYAPYSAAGTYFVLEVSQDRRSTGVLRSPQAINPCPEASQCLTFHQPQKLAGIHSFSGRSEPPFKAQSPKGRIFLISIANCQSQTRPGQVRSSQVRQRFLMLAGWAKMGKPRTRWRGGFFFSLA